MPTSRQSSHTPVLVWWKLFSCTARRRRRPNQSLAKAQDRHLRCSRLICSTSFLLVFHQPTFPAALIRDKKRRSWILPLLSNNPCARRGRARSAASWLRTPDSCTKYHMNIGAGLKYSVICVIISYRSNRAKGLSAAGKDPSKLSHSRNCPTEASRNWHSPSQTVARPSG